MKLEVPTTLVPLMAAIAAILVVAWVLYHLYEAFFVDAVNSFLP